MHKAQLAQTGSCRRLLMVQQIKRHIAALFLLLWVKLSSQDQLQITIPPLLTFKGIFHSGLFSCIP